MRLSIAVFAAAVAVASAFTSPTAFRPRTCPLFMATTVEEIPIQVTGNNIQLTEPLEDYVRSKLKRPLEKVGSSNLAHGVSCEVYLLVNKNPKVKNAHRVEVTTNLKGVTIRSTEESPDMYASIDAVADRLQRKLVKYKERKKDGYHSGKHMGEEVADAMQTEAEAEEAAEDYLDPEAPLVTKIKSFDLSKPISLQEAIFALDYIDHDFYVFRDEKTKEINVVYKRNAGGVGLIQPQL